jgi:septal ring factor EnvC (AmiA/AmiB activator)
MEQEFERRRTKNIEVCRADFHSKTDAALVRYKQGREALERQVRDLEAELKGVHEVRRGTERALAEADATINSLRCDVQRLEEENSVMVQQQGNTVVPLTPDCSWRIHSGLPPRPLPLGRVGWDCFLDPI